MKKKFLLTLILSAFIAQTLPATCASSYGNTPAVNLAIKKYKRGNYTGCLQDCQDIVKKNPKNALAYYYMAMAYAQAGRKDEAIKNYGIVLGLKTTSQLSEYASTGKRCLETPEQCHVTADTPTNVTPELDTFINAKNKGNFSDSVNSDFTQKRLNNVRYQINKDKELDNYNFRNFRDYSNQKTESEQNHKIAQSKPTEQEISAAMKVLNDAGISTYPQNPMLQTQNSDYAQLNALLGNSTQNKNNDIMNVIPILMTQNQNGQGVAPGYTPQAVQAIILNSMMNDLNLNTNTNNNR